MGENNYIAQRLSAIGTKENPEMEALKAENEQLKRQLEQIPSNNFKSEAQEAFEQSPEFESILNAFYLRFIRSKFGAEFKNSAYNQDFQTVANQAFAEFEKNYRKETPKNAQTGKKNTGANEADAGKNA